jgi:hypothetical protein
MRALGATPRGVVLALCGTGPFGPIRARANTYEEGTDQAGNRRRQALQRRWIFAVFLRDPARTPSAQDIQLEASPKYPLSSDLVVAAHLRVCASLFTA